MKKENITYLLARLPIGMSFLGHGLIRLTKLSAFAHGLSGQFSKSFLPLGLVTLFANVLPFLEFAVGIMLLLGLFTRFACIVGVLVMLALIFGSCMIEQWENVFIQLIYSGYLALLYNYADHNKFAVDGALKS